MILKKAGFAPSIPKYNYVTLWFPSQTNQATILAGVKRLLAGNRWGNFQEQLKENQVEKAPSVLIFTRLIA